MAKEKAPDPHHRARVHRYRAGRKRAGFVQVQVFVAASDAQKVRDYARKLRGAAAKRPR